MGDITTLRLRQQDDLRRAHALARWLTRPHVDDVRLELPWLDDDTRTRQARRMRDLFNDCGCHWGAPLALLALAATLPGRLAGGLSIGDFATLAAAFTAGGLSGKAVGLGISRARLRTLLTRLDHGGLTAGAER